MECNINFSISFNFEITNKYNKEMLFLIKDACTGFVKEIYEL